MAIDKQNIMTSSKNFEGNIAEFQRLLDAPQALWRYILDKANVQSFFQNIPNLAISKAVDSNVWDEVLLDEKWNIAVWWPGLPWPYKSDRQLTGNEAMVDAAFRRDRMTVGLRRYAVAVENYLQSDLLPKEMIVRLRNSLTDWVTMMNDLDVATMIFRDFPYYMAESSTLTASEIDRRILSMFGRGTLNDVQTSPIVVMPNGKTDIEDLDDTDTLSDTFLEQLQVLADQEVWITQLALEDQRPFFGLIVGDPDIQNLYKNSSASFVSTLNTAFQGSEWKHPLFKKTLGEYANIRLIKYAWMATNDWRDAYASFESVYKHITGNPFMPMAKVLAVAKGDETVANLKAWWAGDLPVERSWLDGNATTLNIYVTVWAEHFPFFSWDSVGVTPNVVKVWAESYNKAEVWVYDGDWDNNPDSIDVLSYSTVTAWDLVGRFQVWEYDDTRKKWKVLYTWPYFVGVLQIGDNKTPFAQVQLVYRFRVQALYYYDKTAGNWVLVDDTTYATEVDNFKSFLWIDIGTNVIKVDNTTAGITMQKNRKVHIFNTVRTVLMWQWLYYEAEIEKYWRVVQQNNDYEALTGWGITVSKGRKLVRATDGSIRSYAVVIFKRPSVLQ